MADEPNPYAKYVSPGNPYAKYAPATGTQQPQPSKPAETKPQSLSEALALGAQADAIGAPTVVPTMASVAQGALDLPEGIAQAAGIDLPGPLKAIKKKSNEAVMPGLGRAVGAVANPVNWFFPEARLPGLLRTGASALRGGLSSLFTAQPDARSFWKGAPERAVTGAALGGVLGAAGGRASKDVKHLLDNDIRVTPSSMVAGRSGSKAASWLPGFGEAVQHGENVTLHDYNRRLFRWALEGLNLDPRAPLKAGSEALNYAYSQIAQRLEHANAALELTPFVPPRAGAAATMSPLQLLAPGFQQVGQRAAATMSPSAHQQFMNAVNMYFVQPALNNNGRLAGPVLAKSVSDFLQLARNSVRGNASQDGYALADAFRDMVHEINQTSTGPQWAKTMRDAASTSYAKYKVLEDAAAAAGVRAEGVITPSSFLQAQQRQIGRARFQRDDIPFADSQAMKDLSEAANRVLGPTSGYPFQQAVSPLVGLEILRDVPHALWALPALGGWAAAHSGPGMSAARSAAQAPRGALPGLTGPVATGSSDVLDRRTPQELVVTPKGARWEDQRRN